MSKRVKEASFRALLKSFWGIDEDDYQQDDISDEEAIKRCDEVDQEVKENLLKSISNRSKLESILKYNSKSSNKKSRMKFSKNTDNIEKESDDIENINISREDEELTK